MPGGLGRQRQVETIPFCVSGQLWSYQLENE